MSNGDEYGISNDSGDGSRGSLNPPSHGSLPKWLEDMSETVIRSKSAKKEAKPDPLYHLVDLHSLKDGSSIPSRLSYSECTTLEKANSRPSSINAAKFGRRSSLASQLYAQNAPRHIMISKSDYLIPRLDGKLDLDSLHGDLRQQDLEKSWKSLNVFQRTHKGRLDSAKNGITTTAFANYESGPPSLNFLSEEGAPDCYSPSFLEHLPPARSKSEMSNYVPFYVYSNIRRATENEGGSSSYNLHPRATLLDYAMSKAKSSEDIYSCIAPETKLSKTSVPSPAKLLEEKTIEHYFERSNIEKHLNEYRLKVDQENRLRERIINELLTENEKITERLRHKNAKNKLESWKVPGDLEDAPLHQKLYNRNSKYKSTPNPKPIDKEADSGSLEKENLIEYYIEGLDSDFIIPELPTGKILRIEILSTWGDKHYVGLNGIEIFNSNGKIAEVKKITACPADVNVLPENHNDPRVVTNLLDGVNRTQDDVHLWLAPFDENSQHLITVEFRSVTSLAMIRIWNYNKSRIHSFRGVRDVVMTLDGDPIFRGEIAKACGGIMGGVDAFGDTILFTTDDDILEMISQNDRSYSTLTTNAKPDTPPTMERPPTVATRDDRPFTGIPQTEPYAEPKDQILLGARQVDIVLLSNWGYANVIGLTGLEVIGMSDSSIPIPVDCLTSSSKVRTQNLRALVDGVNVTTEMGNMWWVPFRAGQDITISVTFEDFTYISGLRLWNYNQSPETTYAGARVIKILLDGKTLTNPLTKDEVFLLRRAPGNTHYDFVQDVRLADVCTTPIASQAQFNSTFSSLNLYRSELPEGFVFQFIIFSTWGDQYYCGLNEIELYNEIDGKIILEEQNVCAYPESINVLPGVNGDIRTPDKLIDGVTNDEEGAHSWLAPIIPKCLNRIYIVLDQPITVSLIKLWNYSKAPNRGIKEFAVLVDDLLVYNGVLDKYSKKKDKPSYRSILFTDDKKVIEREYDTYIRHSSYIQEVVLLDENRTTTGGSLPNPDQTLRPFTSVSPSEKGYTTQ